MYLCWLRIELLNLLWTRVFACDFPLCAPQLTAILRATVNPFGEIREFSSCWCANNGLAISYGEHEHASYTHITNQFQASL